MTPYYEANGITIYCGDSCEILPQIISADIVITDPPYGIKKVPRTYAQRGSESVVWDDDFPLWWLEDAARIAPVLAWMPGIANLPRCPLVVGRLQYKWTLAIHVSNGMTRSPIGYGNWISCVLYTSGDVSCYQQQSDIARIAISPRSKPDHPSPKPIEAMRWLVKRLPGNTILDPFMGSGTTLVAAAEAGRRAVGIEIEERYCEVAAKRLSTLVEQGPTNG